MKSGLLGKERTIEGLLKITGITSCSLNLYHDKNWWKWKRSVVCLDPVTLTVFFKTSSFDATLKSKGVGFHVLVVVWEKQ